VKKKSKEEERLSNCRKRQLLPEFWFQARVAGLKMEFAQSANSGGLSKHGVLRYAQNSKLKPHSGLSPPYCRQ
jgi:hypothetical protein